MQKGFLLMIEQWEQHHIYLRHTMFWPTLFHEQQNFKILKRFMVELDYNLRGFNLGKYRTDWIGSMIQLLSDTKCELVISNRISQIKIKSMLGCMITMNNQQFKLIKNNEVCIYWSDQSRLQRLLRKLCTNDNVKTFIYTTKNNTCNNKQNKKT